MKIGSEKSWTHSGLLRSVLGEIVSQWTVGRGDGRFRRRRRGLAEQRRVVLRVEQDDLDHRHDDGQNCDLKIYAPKSQGQDSNLKCK